MRLPGIQVYIYNSAFFHNPIKMNQRIFLKNQENLKSFKEFRKANLILIH